MANKAAQNLLLLASKFRRTLLALSVVLLLFLLVGIFGYSTKTTEVYRKDYYNAHYKIFSLRIPQQLDFSGESVPVKDFTVAEYLDRELIVNTYWHSQTLLMFKRANRWFPVIEPILKRYNVPDDFKYIALVESGLTNVVSPAGATGYWQMIESTASNYGLEIDEDVDERYNIERSTEAACKYFLEAYDRLHNWTLVAASYNLGIGGIENQLKKQKAESYYDLFLNDETARYVFRILAMKDIFSRPDVYGFVVRKKDMYPQVPVVRLTVDSTISDLSEFAAGQGVSFKILKLMNPWLRKDFMSNTEGKKYSFLLPKKGVDYTKWETYLVSDTNYYNTKNNATDIITVQ